jgi:S1-C subfamily serine protease
MLGALALAACATAAPPPLGPGEAPAVLPGPAPVAPVPAAEAPCTAFARAGVLRRSAVSRTLDAGLGQWLAGGVDVDRSLAGGRFQGWAVRSLYPGDPCYREVDVRVGDVVVRINGQSIERPEQASEVFSSLRTAPALVVDLLRGGQSRTVTIAIAAE